MNNLKLLKQLLLIGPRCADKEIVAVKIIADYLESLKITYKLQTFNSFFPLCENKRLIVDHEEISCLGSSLVSGTIPNNQFLFSHLGSIPDNLPYNLAYSPLTDEISVVDHFEVPSLTISRNDILKILMAKEIKGEIKVRKQKFDSANILVGNLTKPKNIIFAHFDSIIGQGASDNAAAILVLVNLITQNVNILTNSLFVFCGNEEMSYDSYKKSGYGFRVFESIYSQILKSCQKVYVLDGLGITEPAFSQKGLDWVLQLKMLSQIEQKISGFRVIKIKLCNFFTLKKM
ncbi:hypothetical protein GYA19_05635 [Candidatus Beckwithbacteria bacterium]|nr:hypothetical protein [Candidatus Beckwithbacteria bacterium]